MDRRRLLLIATLAAAPLATLAPWRARANSAEKKKSGGGAYVQIDTLLGTMVRANGSRGVLSVDFGLFIPDSALRTLAEQSVPRLRAACLQVIQPYAAGLPSGALPNAEYIAQILQRTTDTVLGRPGARVLLGSIVAN
jgi:hypothetical protein